MTNGRKSIYEHMTDLVSSAPDKHFLCDETGWFSTLQVLSLAEHMASAFLKADIHNGDYILLKTKQNVPTVIGLFALKTVGATVILSEKDLNDDILSNGFGPGTGIKIKAAVEQTSKTGYFITYSNGSTCLFDMFSLKPSRIITPRPALDKPAFILSGCDVYGSTGTVTLTESDIFSGKPDFHLTQGYVTNGRILVAASLNSVIGIYSISRAALYDYSVYISATRDEKELLSIIDKERITGISAPSSVYPKMCEYAVEYDHSSLCTGFTCGIPLSAEEKERVSDTLGIELFNT